MSSLFLLIIDKLFGNKGGQDINDDLHSKAKKTPNKDTENESVKEDVSEEAELPKKKKRKSKKNKYVKKVAEATGWTYKEASKNMKIAESQLGIPFEIYYRHKYYDISRSGQERKAGKYHRHQKRDAQWYSRINAATGMTAKDVNADIKKYNALKLYKIDLELYFKYGMHLMSESENEALLRDLSEIKKLTPGLKAKLEQVDKGELQYADIKDDLDEYNAIISKTVTPTLTELRSSFLRSADIDLSDEPDKLKDFIVDMEMSRFLFQFTYGEYIMYHLYRFDIEGKREFLSDRDRIRILSRVTRKEVRDILNNKYFLYQNLGSLFDREIIAVYSKKDKDSFLDFVSRHDEFVLKPFNESMGRGVTLIKVDKEKDPEELFRELLEQNRTFLMEERIFQDERMAAFNKDSLNTVRLMIYHDGEKAIPINAFMRTGRVGSFVDNGGAGGIMSSIDIKTGTVESDGGDEKGRHYVTHPDSGIAYKGFKLPNWEDAIRVGSEGNAALGGSCFVGWDLALNDKGKWVIVEGNSYPQFLNQITLGHGLKHLLDKVKPRE